MSAPRPRGPSLNLHSRRLALSGLALGFVLLAVLAGLAAYTVLQNRSFNTAVTHTWEVETKLFEVQSLFEQAESSRRGYLIRRDARFAEAHARTTNALPATLAELARLIRDNPRQIPRVAELRGLSAARATARERSFALVDQGRSTTAMAEFGGPAGSREVLRVRELLDVLRAEERRLLDLRRRALADGQRRANVSLALSSVLLAGVAVSSLVLMRRYTTELSASRDQLRRLNVGLEDAVAARTADLQRANAEIQRFAYIVSHDLRSPLVNVMGFTSEIESTLPALRELMERADPAAVTRDARIALESELPESIGFIRAATGRMDRLINAILRLSREGRRTLTPQPLNMQVLLDGVVASHRSRAETLGASMTVQWPMPDLINDRLAIEQVFGNLVDNALKYLKPGVPGRIVVRGRLAGASAVFEVEDNGRGIDPRDHERVFDLFRRAGVQDQQGEGIGLAHTRALVHRLGGSISVASELDRGAVFRVSLPTTMPPQDAIA